MRGIIAALMGTGRKMTVLVFCGGVMIGVLMMSLVSSYTSVYHHMVYKSMIKSSGGQELVELVKEYNKTRSLHTQRQDAPTSHDQDPVYFRDHYLHHDDTSAADELHRKVRVLCWVLTTKNNHQKKAFHVKATWGKRCNKLLFISDADDASLPSVRIDILSGREHLTAKTMQAFDMIYKEVDNFDWFMKADDDTYVVLENLRYFLSSQNPDSPIYFGHHFMLQGGAQGYFSGGGGYAVSREALRRYGKRKPDICATDGGDEDVQFGRCMTKLGVKTGDSRDNLGRSRFHSFDLALFIKGVFPDWYYRYDKYGAKGGMENISDYAISFHYVVGREMYDMEFLLYHMRPYGINSGNQNLNVAVQAGTTSQNSTDGAR